MSEGISFEAEARGRAETEFQLPHRRTNWLERQIMKLVYFIRRRWRQRRDRSDG